MGSLTPDWWDFFRAAGILRPMIVISESVWIAVKDRLSKSTAAAALALVFEKVRAGEVICPCVCLNVMVENSEAVKPYIRRSFVGRLKRPAACVCVTADDNKRP
ncbi:replication initiation protein RepC [uncultured Tateyamaria sp.]|uniref:replication initiation protein RepC n=1 Tax=uncultured Tateyamaria sp. TaxID=455651 RepID=UPI003426D3FC